LLPRRHDDGWRMDDRTVDEVVREIEHAPHEGLVLAGPLLLERQWILERVLEDETPLRARRHDDGVLDHLRLEEPQDLGSVVLTTVVPADPGTCDPPSAR